MYSKKRKETIKNNKLFEFSILLLGTTIYALSFNLFLLPNSIVAGFSGLSVIANTFFGIRPSVFIFFGYLIILIFSLIILGWKTTKKMIIGSLIYPFLVEATSYIIPYIEILNIEKFMQLLCGALMCGFGSGILYKIGYSTGGSDVINHILSKVLRRPMGTAVLITNGTITLFGFLAFGLSTFIYSLLVVYIMSIVVDKVMLGISASKTFSIITDDEKKVKSYLLEQLRHGVTVIPAYGGYTDKDVKMIMCVIPTSEYAIVKDGILDIDPNALIMVSDVYQVLGNK